MLLIFSRSQLTHTKMPASIDEERDAIEEVSGAAKGVKALLILDDCWNKRHATVLNVVDADAGSACIITTLSLIHI